MNAFISSTEIEMLYELYNERMKYTPKYYDYSEKKYGTNEIVDNKLVNSGKKIKKLFRKK